jgi:hypothetical protein
MLLWIKEKVSPDIIAVARHLSAKRRPLPEIGHESDLPDEAKEWLSKHLAGDCLFIEYGAGASTLFALDRVKIVISVETDRRWIKEVKRRHKTAAELHGLCPHIGLVGGWGFPVVRKPTARRLARWRAYVESPWRKLEQIERRFHLQGKFPPKRRVVLVDGRFRVACVLHSLLSQAEESTCDFLMDDFFNRESEYGAILPFVAEIAQLGRALAFRRVKNFDQASAVSVRDQYLREPL